jgi:catalase
MLLYLCRTRCPVRADPVRRRHGPGGPTLLQDMHLPQKLQCFDRERIPQRVVHATGTGAHGSFKVTDDLSDLTKAAMFKRDTVTPVFVRFSTVIPSRSGAETARDPRGFATTFYTQEGNWDLVGNKLPIFFIRDAIKFPDMVNSLKPDPVTNVQEPERGLYSNYGTPANYREMNGSSVHALKFINARGEATYVKFASKSQQAERNLRAQEAAEVQGRSTSHATVDLYESIKAGTFPRRDLTVQILKPRDLNKFDYDPLDPAKIWTGIPERKVGAMTLERVPDNFFEATEQVAMAPGNLVPGIEALEDRLLQGRLFSYIDTQQQRIAKTLNFRQAGEFYRSLSKVDRDDLIASLSGDLKRVKNDETRETMLSHFWKTDAGYGKRLVNAVGADPAKIAARVAVLKE